MCEFKKGDKIVCINTDNHDELKKGKVYEVEKPNGDFVYLKNCKYGYFTFLFKKECGYCNINILDALAINKKNEAVIINQDIKTGKFFIDGLEKIIPVNYCPMCRKKVRR